MPRVFRTCQRGTWRSHRRDVVLTNSAFSDEHSYRVSGTAYSLFYTYRKAMAAISDVQPVELKQEAL
jgi:hypothetical protein